MTKQYDIFLTLNNCHNSIVISIGMPEWMTKYCLPVTIVFNSLMYLYRYTEGFNIFHVCNLNPQYNMILSTTISHTTTLLFQYSTTYTFKTASYMNDLVLDWVAPIHCSTCWANGSSCMCLSNPTPNTSNQLAMLGERLYVQRVWACWDSVWVAPQTSFGTNHLRVICFNDAFLQNICIKIYVDAFSLEK